MSSALVGAVSCQPHDINKPGLVNGKMATVPGAYSILISINHGHPYVRVVEGDDGGSWAAYICVSVIIRVTR
jgi:hypothetical protein